MVLHLRVWCFVLLDVHQLKLFHSQAKLFTLKPVDAVMIYVKVKLFTILSEFFTGNFLRKLKELLSKTENYEKCFGWNSVSELVHKKHFIKLINFEFILVKKPLRFQAERKRCIIMSKFQCASITQIEFLLTFSWHTRSIVSKDFNLLHQKPSSDKQTFQKYIKGNKMFQCMLRIK